MVLGGTTLTVAVMLAASFLIGLLICSRVLSRRLGGLDAVGQPLRESASAPAGGASPASIMQIFVAHAKDEEELRISRLIPPAPS